MFVCLRLEKETTDYVSRVMYTNTYMCLESGVGYIRSTRDKRSIVLLYYNMLHVYIFDITDKIKLSDIPPPTYKVFLYIYINNLFLAVYNIIMTAFSFSGVNNCFFFWYVQQPCRNNNISVKSDNIHSLQLHISIVFSSYIHHPQNFINSYSTFVNILLMCVTQFYQRHSFTSVTVFFFF